MSNAFALARRYAGHSAEIARFAIVSACACALLAAGQVLPL